MSLKNTSETYGTIARFFHWSVALIIIFLLGLGLYMEGLEFSPEKLSLYGLHKSFGTLVLGLAVLRIVWKLANPAPHHLVTHKPIEIKLAKFIHVCLYLAMFGMPLSGWLMTSAMDYPHTFFRLFDMPDIYPGKNEQLGKLMGEAHELCAFALIGALLLHFAGALKHHVIDKDATLRRMLGVPSIMLAVVLVVGLTAYYKSGDTAAPAAAPTALSDAAAETPQESRAITAPEWILVPEDSYAEFTVTVQGGPFTGKFTGMNGSIHFSPDDLGGSQAHIGVAIASAASGSAERDDSMKLPAWLDATSFPESRFLATDFTHKGGNDYNIAGVLTLRGVTKPIEFPATIEISTDENGNKVAKMNGTFTINRLDFGVGQGEWAATDMVANPVNVRVSVTARAETP
jgi:cytochrome b561